jgi:hypothetical protein
MHNETAADQIHIEQLKIFVRGENNQVNLFSSRFSR